MQNLFCNLFFWVTENPEKVDNTWVYIVIAIGSVLCLAIAVCFFIFLKKCREYDKKALEEKETK